jgi:hypothetical protein
MIFFATSQPIRSIDNLLKGKEGRLNTDPQSTNLLTVQNGRDVNDVHDTHTVL